MTNINANELKELLLTCAEQEITFKDFTVQRCGLGAKNFEKQLVCDIEADDFEKIKLYIAAGMIINTGSRILLGATPFYQTVSKQTQLKLIDYLISKDCGKFARRFTTDEVYPTIEGYDSHIENYLFVNKGEGIKQLLINTAVLYDVDKGVCEQIGKVFIEGLQNTKKLFLKLKAEGLDVTKEHQRNADGSIDEKFFVELRREDGSVNRVLYRPLFIPVDTAWIRDGETRKIADALQSEIKEIINY